MRHTSIMAGAHAICSIVWAKVAPARVPGIRLGMHMYTVLTCIFSAWGLLGQAMAKLGGNLSRQACRYLCHSGHCMLHVPV